MKQAKLELEAYAGAILGARSRQEDASRIWQYPGDGSGREAELILLVADGLGGHASGDIASNMICDAFLAAFERAGGSAVERMRQSLYAAHKVLREAIAAASEREGMGTTLIASHIDEHGLSWLSVGDSMLMHYRGGRLTRLNDDHSMASVLDQQAAAGIISHAEARGNPKRSALRSAVSAGSIALIDARNEPIPLAPGDWLLIASDGLHTLAMDEIAHTIEVQRTNGAKAVAEALLAAVEQRGQPRQDNTTVVVLAVSGAPATRLVTPAAPHEDGQVPTVGHGKRASRPFGLVLATLLLLAAVAAAIVAGKLMDWTAPQLTRKPEIEQPPTAAPAETSKPEAPKAPP